MVHGHGAGSERSGIKKAVRQRVEHEIESLVAVGFVVQHPGIAMETVETATEPITVVATLIKRKAERAQGERGEKENQVQ
jgi:hypothetical protein